MLFEKVLPEWKNHPKSYSTSNIESIIQNKQEQLALLLDSLAFDIRTNNYLEFYSRQERFGITKSLFKIKRLTNIADKGFTVLIYKNGILKCWSDNSVPVDYPVLKTAHKGIVLKLNNGIYLFTQKKIDDITLLGLILIKNQYPFENDFLSNRFDEDFPIPPSVNITFEKSEETENIFDKNNNYLFSLLPVVYSVTQRPFFRYTVALYFISIALLIVFFDNTLRRLKKEKQPVWKMLLLLAFTMFIRYAMQEYKIPNILSLLLVFQPQLYAGWFPSLGDFLVNAILLFSFSRNFYIPLKSPDSLPADAEFEYPTFLLRSERYLFAFFLIIVTCAYFILIYLLLSNLLENSTISFEAYKVPNLDLYSLIGFIIITALIASFILFADTTITYCKNLVDIVCFVMLIVVSSFISYLFFYALDYYPDIFSIGFSILILLFISYIRFGDKGFRFHTFIILTLVASAYSLFFIIDNNTKKEKDIREFLIMSLPSERDIYAEHLLRNVAGQIANDKSLIEYLQFEKDSIPAISIPQYLQKRYFSSSFWRKYSLEVTICGLDIPGAEPNIEECEGYYSEVINRLGTKLPNSGFYFLDKKNGSISYFGSIHFNIPQPELNVILYIELNSKLLLREIGYPELLYGAKQDKRSKRLKEYSYAKYKNHELIAKSGLFQYRLTSDVFDENTSELYFLDLEGYNHLVYHFDNENAIILSKPKLRVIDILIAFSYVFLFYNLLLFVMQSWSKVKNLRTLLTKFEFNFRNKILLSMIAILVISFLVVGGGTVINDINKYEIRHNENISNKIESVVTHFGQIFSDKDSISSNWHSQEFGHLKDLIAQFYLIYFTDVNLYDLKGNLITTSRPEIFETDLISRKMNTEAYRQMVTEKKSKFIQEERIGNSYYSSAYVPFINSDNKVLAYINLPYFTQPGLLTNEIYNLMVTVINLFVVFFLITIVIAVFISNKLTAPLLLLQEKFRDIKLGTTNEEIAYESDDEIGKLVKEHNRMVVELAQSVELLAKSERESAWREMAKQIAHEIKNPLTPMKLHIQHLQRIFNELNSPEDLDKFKSRLSGISKTLIEQIDTLSRIAGEFSNFAKMPRANNEEINIIEILQSSVKLYEKEEEATITLDLQNHTVVTVFADKEQMTRVFINLIKNAIQSVPDNIEGEVDIQVFSNELITRIKIEDNGSGIQHEIKNKLFQPNFTTKSGGMGMGLAIVKNIITNADGTIWFETEKNKGTRFFVELPRYSSINSV